MQCMGIVSGSLFNEVQKHWLARLFVIVIVSVVCVCVGGGMGSCPCIVDFSERQTGA